MFQVFVSQHAPSSMDGNSASRMPEEQAPRASSPTAALTPDCSHQLNAARAPRAQVLVHGSAGLYILGPTDTCLPSSVTIRGTHVSVGSGRSAAAVSNVSIQGEEGETWYGQVRRSPEANTCQGAAGGGWRGRLCVPMCLLYCTVLRPTCLRRS